MADVKIKFVEDYEVQDEKAGTDEATKYKKGKVVSMNEAAAAHFVRGGRAVYYKGK